MKIYFKEESDITSYITMQADFHVNPETGLYSGSRLEMFPSYKCKEDT